MNRAHQEVAKVVTSFPETEQTWGLLASWGGFGGILTKEWEKRGRSTEEMYGQVFGAVS